MSKYRRFYVDIDRLEDITGISMLTQEFDKDLDEKGFDKLTGFPSSIRF